MSSSEDETGVKLIIVIIIIIIIILIKLYHDIRLNHDTPVTTCSFIIKC